MAEFTSLNGYTVKDAIARNIAKGRNQALAYADYATMVETLNAMDNEQFKVGQNIYIGTVGVPDLWVYSIEPILHDYSYVSDEATVELLKNNGTIQVGYYKLAMLEGQKVDLTPVNTKLSEHDIKLSEHDIKLSEHENAISEQNKNLQWFIDNGYLPDPNNPNIVLYDYGKINENMVADFSATGTGSVRTFTKEANYLYSEAGNASGVLLYTVKPINLNNVKKVHFVMINSSTTNTICLNTTMPSSWVELSKEQPIAVTSSPTDLVMDVTDYNGEYYLCVKTKSLSNTKIYKIYLEY